MARAPRLQLAGGIFHVGSRGVRKFPLYHSVDDRLLFLKLLADVCRRYGWSILAYCLMTNHFHFLVLTPNADLSEGMQRLNSRYAQLFNLAHGYEGHALERRFFSELIVSERKLLNTSRYIELNPVRAGICKRPEDWEWSSYRATVGLDAPPPFLKPERLLWFFGGDTESARALYVWFVEDALARPRLP